MYYQIQNNTIAAGPFSLTSPTARKLTQCGNPKNYSAEQLAAAGIYPQWRETGDAPLGYKEPVWEPDNGRVALYRKGTEQERQEAAEAQAAAQAEQEAIAAATTRADEMARVAAVDAVIDGLPDEDVAEMTYVYPAWSGDGVGVVADQKLRHKGILYRVVQPHTTQPDWPPDATPALFTLYRDPQAGPQPWVQPTGAHDAYNTSDRVTHKGSTWESTIDANVWEPGVTGWVVV